MVKLSWCGAIAALSIMVLAGSESRQADSVVDWIRANAIRLTTAEAGHGFADMQPLKRVVGNARIVSLGEATHGSREFFQVKHRMLEFLATEMGFTLFSIEANMPEAYRLNEYVLNGAGDPATLLRGMYFWTWDTEEVLDMIRWMREFNRSGKGRVQFTGFDMQSPEVAADLARDFVARHDPSYLPAIEEAAAMARSVSRPGAGRSFGVATGSFPVSRAGGRKLRYSGYIKTEAVNTGFAGLWWRVDGASGVLAFDNMEKRGATGSQDWTRYAIDLLIPAGATNINFGVLMPGAGTAWFDDLAIELDGEVYSDPDAIDLGFEAPSVKGFFVGGRGYRVQLDAAIARSGRQSLRIESLSPGPRADDVAPRSVTARWKDIVAHMDAGRLTYRSSGAAARDIDWAIQNARVVLQAMQVRADEVSRDRSMADNVKWILDQNAGEKIVLWAHNGHAAGGGFPYETMGKALRRMFGQEMVVFGLAFNQGSFQAMTQGGGGLRTFTVPAAQPGTLDSMLALADIPIFALDLREAPAWFRQARGSRQIGAIYPEGEPHAFVGSVVASSAFDALIFVETTTAARKNPGR